MEKSVCKCGKEIEGYSKEHVAYLMKNHALKDVVSKQRNADV